MLPPDIEPIDETAGLAPEVDGAGVTLALFAAISGCFVGLVIGVLIGWALS
jgi:NhaP-type Na+/H+ or K+/H+ antiporter